MLEELAIAGVAAAAGAAGLYSLSRPPERRSSGDLELHALGDGVYMYRGYFSNSAVFVLPERVVVVDSQVSPRAAERLLAQIRGVTPLPVTHVINTHYHGDHTGGNAVFRGAEVIASEDTRRFVKERDGERVEYADTFGLAFQEIHPTIPPSRTFKGELVLELDGERIVVRQLGRAETPDAAVVFWESRGAVASGDGVSTYDYPYLGVPFLDEGLRDDGEWLRFLGAIRAARPRVLVPGHGPALVGELEIADRLDLLVELYTRLLAEVKAELALGTPTAELVEKVDRRLSGYRTRGDLREHTVSQRFAIYRCINNLLPERKGRGWWHDLRPSVVARAPRTVAEAALAPLLGGEGAARAVYLRARNLVERGERPLAISLLELWTAREPGDAKALALLSDIYFEGARSVPVKVDATEYIALATRAARRAYALDPGEQLALLTLGCAEVFGGMILAQPMDEAIRKLEAALQRGGLRFTQRARALFFLGRAHQVEGRTEASDRAFRSLLPPWAQVLYPLVRDRIRAYP